MRKINNLFLILFMVSFYASIANIFFDHIILDVLTYVFFTGAAIFVLYVLYVVYKNIEVSRSPFKEFFIQQVNSIFHLLLLAFLVSLIINEFYKLRFINMNYFLAVVVVLGILSVLFPYEEKKHGKPFPAWVIVILALAGAVLIFIKTKQMGWLSYIIAAVSFVLIFLLGKIFDEEDIPE